MSKEPTPLNTLVMLDASRYYYECALIHYTWSIFWLPDIFSIYTNILSLWALPVLTWFWVVVAIEMIFWLALPVNIALATTRNLSWSGYVVTFNFMGFMSCGWLRLQMSQPQDRISFEQELTLLKNKI